MKFGCGETTCANCGACCRGWDIELSKEDIRTIAKKGYDINRFLSTDPMPRMKNVGKEKNCIFLDKNNFCVIHTRHGHDVKPNTCKQYPKLDKERMKECDYAFYRHSKTTFSRDIMITILDNLKRVRKEDLFQMFLEELDTVRKQGKKYVDVFNYDDTKKASGLRNFIFERTAKRTINVKLTEREREEFKKIELTDKLDVAVLMEELKKKIPENIASNENLPKMLLAFFYLIQNEEPRDAAGLVNYFFEWNAKRF
ncbi:MAG: YkgJ family cysteine cluster protein [Candidatus Aenigmarchaeota archaeon]|nr:YkgJ family cysteine cluster protein [Candidatus Aenigmarchaeota archaeon]